MKRFLKSNNQMTAQGVSFKQGGFTLVEMMITLVIAAIVLTQAVPSFLTTIKNGRLTTETNKLVADLNLARSEAIKRSKNVVVCSSANPTSSTATCAASSTWTTGWLVFSDDDSSGDYDSSNDTLIHVGMAAEGDVTLYSTDNDVTYTSEGLLSNTSTVAIAICDDRGVSSGSTTYGRQIQIKTTGRPRLITGSDASSMSCTTPTANL
jgi:type IV fimbrial biogenesis protein FimT